MTPPDGSMMRLQPKQAPYSSDAEQAVLGGLMINNRAWDEVRAIVSEDDFFEQRHRLLFFAIGDLLGEGEPADFVTVTEKLREQGNLDEVGGLGFIGMLANDTPSAANVKAWALKIRERSVQRNLIAAGQDIAELGYYPSDRSPSELISAAELLVTGIQARRVSGSRSAADVMKSAMAAVTDAKDRRATGRSVGIPTGIRWIDKRIGGMRPGQLILLAARPSLGKSALLNQIALFAGSQGHPGLVCSLEMNEEEIGLRKLSVIAKVNLTRLSFGADAETAIASRHIDELSRLPLFYDTDTYDLHGICSQITLHKRQHGITWAAVDHVGLVESPGHRSTVDRIAAISRAFKKLAKTLNIPLLVLSQLNREVEKERRKPRISDLRDSGSLEQDANIVLFLHTSADDGTVPLPIDMGLAKNRGGRRGWSDKDLFRFHGAIQTFEEMQPSEPESE